MSRRIGGGGLVTEKTNCEDGGERTWRGDEVAIENPAETENDLEAKNYQVTIRDCGRHFAQLPPWGSSIGAGRWFRAVCLGDDRWARLASFGDGG